MCCRMRVFRNSTILHWFGFCILAFFFCYPVFVLKKKNCIFVVLTFSFLSSFLKCQSREEIEIDSKTVLFVNIFLRLEEQTKLFHSFDRQVLDGR